MQKKNLVKSFLFVAPLIIPALASAMQVVNLNESLLSAARQGNGKDVDFWLRQPETKINYKGPKGDTPLMVAAAGNHVAVVDVLLAAGARHDLVNDSGFTALILAARNQQAAAVVVRLLAAGANVNFTDRDSKSALFHATERGHQEVALTLLKTPGIHVNDVGLDQYHWTPLLHATHNSMFETTKRLVELGANVHATHMYGMPLHWAADRGPAESVAVLLTAGAPVNTLSHLGHNYALTLASGSTHLTSLQAVKLLLAAGAFVDPQGDGKAPLVIAAENGFTEKVNCLLQAGARQLTAALQAANNNSHHDVVALLQRALKQ